MKHSSPRPRLLLTMGDVAGIGPEIIARAWPDLQALCQPVVVGDPDWLRRGLELVGSPAQVQVVDHPTAAEPAPDRVPCVPGGDQDLSQDVRGRRPARGGGAASVRAGSRGWT